MRALRALQAVSTANVRGRRLTFVGILDGMHAAIAAIAVDEAVMHDKKGRILVKLFEQNGFDLRAGDVMYVPVGMVLDVPARYCPQVQQNKLVSDGQILFTENPAFSLF